MNFKSTFLALFLVCFSFGAVYSQTKVQLKQADKLEGAVRNNEQFQKLLGDVILTQNTTTIFCDSAYLFKTTNRVEAFGHVKITDGDSVTITSKRLEYDGNEKLAKLRGNVIFTKLKTATLYTENLDFDRIKNQAYYFNGGKLVDSTNVLNSKKGYYNINNDMMSFKKEVDVKNPDYSMQSDSLQYNSRTKIIYFRSPTNVIKKNGDRFDYEGGEYNTTNKLSDFAIGTLDTKSYTIEAGSYRLDDRSKFYMLRKNVVMVSKEEQLIIHGQSADYDRKNGVTKVFNNAYFAKVIGDQDTLYIGADTLVSIESDDPAKKQILAYNNVKIFRTNMQGVADSLEYRASDSTVYFYKDPVLWSDGNQMTADSVSLLLKNKKLHKLYMISNAFVISRDSLQHYNQIKGRKMTADFSNSTISRVVVEGNGESIYFALDETNQFLMGMNKTICSNITIRFARGQVNNLTFYTNPEANFIPPHELKSEDKALTGFQWLEESKPKRSDVVKSKLPEETKGKTVSNDTGN